MYGTWKCAWGRPSSEQLYEKAGLLPIYSKFVTFLIFFLLSLYSVLSAPNLFTHTEIIYGSANIGLYFVVKSSYGAANHVPS
jgi:hypothetical protein